MATWPSMPEEVVIYVREVFAEANRQATELLVNMPNVRETSLDDHLINALIPQSPPRRLASGCVVEMDIHNIGGLRRVYGWETADIAVLVFVYQGTRMVGRKVGLLQSKRLFPQTGEVMDEDEVGFRYGMNAMLNRSSSSPLGSLSRRFVFDGDCLYSAIKADEQVDVIERHNREFGESVYYLLYAPSAFPVTVTYPVTSRIKLTTADNGCFVLDAPTVHRAIRDLPKGASPSHRILLDANANATVKLETWAADLLLTCKVGQQFGPEKEELVGRLLERRSGPIGAAIAISVALPQD